jgi:hypothetical protein
MTDKNEMSDILSANYMLASLTVRVWSGRKTDHDATEELLSSKGAMTNAASVIKSLLAGNDRELKDTQAAYSRIRTWFYAHSLPWTTQDGGQRGDRIVGTMQAMAFLRDFARLKTEAEKSRDAFVDAYDAAVSNASISLGQLYNRDQYPTKDAVRHMFGATLDIAPMPAVTDFDRIAIPGAMAEGLKGKYEMRAKAQVECAVSDLQQRVLEELERMATQLGKVAKGEKARLFQSLTGNMKTLAQLARTMGPLDPSLNDLAERIEDELLRHEVAAYKDNAALAGKVAAAADGIRADILGVPVVAMVAQVQQAQEEPAEPTATVAYTDDFDTDEMFY